MSPLDPKETSSADPKPPMAPPFHDENPNQDAVEQGMSVAEDETREAVTNAYEATAQEEQRDADILEDPSPDETEADGIPTENEAIRRDPAGGK
jgi:hypothetical protein